MLNWEMELKRWCPSFKILTYYGAQKERKLKRQVWSSVWSLSLLMSFSFRSFLYVNYLAYFPVASFSCWYYLISSNLISVFEYFNTSFISSCVFLCFFFSTLLYAAFFLFDLLGLDQAQCFPCVYHILQAGATGSPGFSSQELALSHSGWGSEHQEFQVPTVAVTAQLQQVKMNIEICGRVVLAWRVGCLG